MAMKDLEGGLAAGLGDAVVTAGGGSPGNDNGIRRGVADTTALAPHPEVVAVLKGTLHKYGRRPQELEDDVPEVLTRAIESARRGPMPKDLGAWKALVTTIAPRYAIDAQRARVVRRRLGAEVGEDPERCWLPELVTPRDPVDTQRFLAVLRALFQAGRMPEMAGEVLWGVADGLSKKEIGAEVGLTERQVEGRLLKMRRLFTARLEQLGMLDEKSKKV
jgi:DNA-directed RNA polymerase specialized sigma24 family protein